MFVLSQFMRRDFYKKLYNFQIYYYGDFRDLPDFSSSSIIVENISILNIPLVSFRPSMLNLVRDENFWQKIEKKPQTLFSLHIRD